MNAPEHKGRAVRVLEKLLHRHLFFLHRST